jgi:tRNA(Ile)-lysidine synthase
MDGRLATASSAAPPIVHHLLARASFPAPGTPVVCAVSGGADSTALLVLAVAAGCRAEAVHVDHGLRPGSAADADLVGALAERLQVPWRTVRVEVEPGPNLEARARAARYAALPPDVCTGHTADDQAETVLLALLRGASTHGLAGMRSGAPADDGSVRRGGPRRPLLGLRRSDTVALSAALGVDVVDDPSNRDPRHRRNRVRHELLALLDDIADRDVVPILVRQAALLRDDDELLDALAAGIDPTDARALAGAPVALARRAVRAWLAAAHPCRQWPDAAAVARVLDVARGAALACEVPEVGRVTRRARRLSITAPGM